MDAQALLEQLLARGKEMANQGKNIAEQKLNIPAEGAERDAVLGGMGKGALAAGALALLLGTKSGRRMTGTGLKLGSLAALGGLGYQAFKQWQASQQGSGQSSPQLTMGQPVDQLQGAEANDRAETLLRAMIMAAKADGHIDAEEQSRISGEVERLGLDNDVATFLETEMAKPLDATSVASRVSTAEAAAEVYLASLYVIGSQTDAERTYLAQLATALNLPATLVAELEHQMAA